ncbi:MAG TPA: hypothetical protein PKC76_15960 [Saprospiraceae bacterium]|nr:hypothetical protein [Saprospiraceae bacterium]HMP25627.1 hypothetical protein [Saprospiraceae bacterium]
MPYKIWIILYITLCFTACNTASKVINFSERAAISGKVTHTGLIDCFAEGLSYDGGVPVYCEASAVVKTGETLLIGIDKPVPGEQLSPVFTIPVDQLKEKQIAQSKVNYILAEPFREMQKIEAFTVTPDNRFFATTAFDRIRSKPDWDSYNSIATWTQDDFSDVAYVLPIENEGVTSSKVLRSSIKNALKNEAFPDGPPYFKIEAMTALPGNRILFGVRELGESYEKFSYTFTLLEATYDMSSFGVAPAPEFRKIYAFQPEVNGRKLGISDMIYHAASNALIALTSYEGSGDEKTKDMATYIWVLPMARLERGEAPILVQDGNQPLEIAHKGEGLVMLDDNTLFIVHDEDRKESNVALAGGTVRKKPHQAVFSIVQLK